MLLFIQTLPRILCAGAISRVSSYRIGLDRLLGLCNYFSGELCTAVGGRGRGRGVPMDLNSENAFSKGIFWPNSVHIKTTLNINISERRTEK